MGEVYVRLSDLTNLCLRHVFLLSLMVLEIPYADWKKLTHKERRALINKEKKKTLRKNLAEQRKREEAEIEETEEGILQKLPQFIMTEHQDWLEKDLKSHKEFCERKENEEKRQKEREAREKLIREEWEALERKGNVLESKTKDEINDTSKEAMLAQALTAIDESLGNMEEEQNLMDTHVPWHNPFAPMDMLARAMNILDDNNDSATPSQPEPPSKPEKDNYGTEKDRVNCPFFIKTGACRYGDHCSRVHPIPDASTTLIIRNMYHHVVLTQQLLDEHDQDVGLELDEDDMLKDFKEFFEDVFPEFEKFGEIVQFKISCNNEAHLRGNLYVQYTTEEACAEAIQNFNGRWYAGKQLSCEFCPVQKWKTAICGLNDKNQCPKGRHCNFLHVFENPNGKFNSWQEGDEPINRLKHDRSRSPERGRYTRQHRHSPDRGRRRPSYKDDNNRWKQRRRRSRSPRHYPRRRSQSGSDEDRRSHRRRSSRDRYRNKHESDSDDRHNGRRRYDSDSDDSDLSPIRKGSDKDKKSKKKHKKHHRSRKKHNKYSTDDDD